MKETSHPRLYFTAEDLPRLRALREEGLHATIWQNMQESAEWCLTREPRAEWIAPVAPDPIYENLYDRFYAIMGDLGITEHLAFAYALSGEEKYGEAARQWTLASCRVWKKEADGKPDGGKAYAVCRLLKGVATGYDLAYDQFTGDERDEIRDTLSAITDLYHREYFLTPAKSGPGFHTHHAVVEYASQGVAALALLGEDPRAEEWLQAVVTKFEDHLLPTGLAEDGAQVEGQSFWASTMQYRLFFMDALRRVTGRDLFADYGQFQHAELARASIAAEKDPGWNEGNQTVILSPPYAQIDYYSLVLLCLAREYRRPVDQHLALWDRSMGHVQKTRYVHPKTGEQMLFGMGGYAYVWYDPTAPTGPIDAPLIYHFPSVNHAYARASWEPDDLLVGVQDAQVVIHAGGLPVLNTAPAFRYEGLPVAPGPPTPLTVQEVTDNGATAVIRAAGENGAGLIIELHRPDRVVVRRTGVPGAYWFWSMQVPDHEGDTLTWKGRARLQVLKGRITKLSPDSYHPVIGVGNGVLVLSDPHVRWYPQITLEPAADGEIIYEVRRIASE